MYLVSGATGNVGGEVVRALLDGGHKVRALVREGRESAVPAAAEATVGDLNRPGTIAAALDGVRGVFLLAGYDNVAEALDEFHTAGVERVVLLSANSVLTGNLGNAVSRYHILSEEAIRDSGLAYTFLRPSEFMTNAYRWLPQLAGGDVVRVPFADVPAAVVDPHDIASVAAAALTSREHAGRAYLLTGPEALLPGQRLQILGSVLGRDLRVEAIDDETARAEMLESTPEPYVDAFFEFARSDTYTEATVHPDVRDVLGRPPRAFRQWAEAHADAFR